LLHPADARHVRNPAPLRRATACLAAALAVPVLLAVAPAATASPGSKAVAVPRIKTALPAAIEDMPPYVPQVSCDATPKPGAVALMNLLLKTYPGSTNLGIAQTCAAEGMTSEHAEGRALDWGVNRNNPRQRAQAQAFLSWLFATDSDGNDQAMARRLGVMYVIWNDRIRSTGGDWRPYDASVCSKKRHSPTTCHENHVHISLTWAGAWKRTSFWTGHVAADDYGPCRTALQVKANKPAHKYTRPNLTPCAGSRHGHGGWGGSAGSGGGGTGSDDGGTGSTGDPGATGAQCPDGTTQVGEHDGVLICATDPTTDPTTGPATDPTTDPGTGTGP
jgi:uncharacterized membrane protein YgcG